MDNLNEIMAKDVFSSSPDTSLAEIARLMVEHDYGEIPLVENSKVVGVITDRDIVCRTLGVGKNSLDLTAQDCMTSPAITATPNMAVDECVDLIEVNKIRRIPIVDENGILFGMVSQADLIQEVDQNLSGRNKAFNSNVWKNSFVPFTC